MTAFNKELDASGLHCPMPVLRSKKALDGMASGEVLHIISTDPASKNDVPSFAKSTRNELLEAREEAGKFHYYIRKT
ncbi:MAG: sulfurtransferase TusA family protein [Gammaproteobacteria bacterium]|nr:sulfurtransferase TusA family protein [Gammaproteobacteria bacterium]